MKDELLKMIKEKGYRKGEFTLSSGRKSEHYVNCKPITLDGRGLAITSAMLMECIDEKSVAVAGLTLGADPLVSGVAIMSAFNRGTLSGLIVRKEAKGHGTNEYIEGPLPPEGSRVTVLEDVVTTGESSIKAVKRLRDAGYEVKRIVSIIDRQENEEANTAFKLAGLEFYSLFSLEELYK
jgi:orotate phosphoribosyltransferase|tara:strand:+ start:522 stop:1061 length:540 start_codon:yes stop_codon:yes gene_type:complete